MSMDTEQLLKISLIYSYVLAATVFLGGVMGFVKAKSKASLIASSCVACGILALDYVTLEVSKFQGQLLQVLLYALVSMMFQRKYSASGGQLEEPLSGAPSGKKFMPFGLLTLMSCLGVLLSGSFILAKY
ncbi:unnamed protein product [Durusdinium trenchii]|uniref:Uncharacterized protein n=1 Tax=Durusdinium trenchii TaxID=1381693 RepID=A0ABP0NWX3_9DINO